MWDRTSSRPEPGAVILPFRLAYHPVSFIVWTDTPLATPTWKKPKKTWTQRARVAGPARLSLPRARLRRTPNVPLALPVVPATLPPHLAAQRQTLCARVRSHAAVCSVPTPQSAPNRQFCVPPNLHIPIPYLQLSDIPSFKPEQSYPCLSSAIILVVYGGRCGEQGSRFICPHSTLPTYIQLGLQPKYPVDSNQAPRMHSFTQNFRTHSRIRQHAARAPRASSPRARARLRPMWCARTANPSPPAARRAHLAHVLDARPSSI